MRDAIVLGYQLQGVPGRDVNIPEWYALAENELGLSKASPMDAAGLSNFLGTGCCLLLLLIHLITF